MKMRKSIAVVLLLAVILSLVPAVSAAAVCYEAVDAVSGVTTSGNDFVALTATVAEGSVVTVLRDVTDDITISKNLHLELDGHTITGTVTVEEDVTLQVSDRATADYTDGAYGKIKVAGEGKVVGAAATEDSDVYVMAEESNGYVSFHAAKLNIDAMVLRAENAGIYFEHKFDGDSKVKALVASYGIAFSLENAPSQEDLKADSVELKTYVRKSGDVVYTAYPAARFAYGTTANTNTSTLITGIMKEANGVSINSLNAKNPIHGVAYVKLADGSVVLGAARERSFQQQVEGIDARWDTLSDGERKTVLKMYKTPTIKTVVDGWTVPNLKNPAKVQKAGGDEEKIFRVLSIGNSHTDNATEYLYNIFQAENPDKQVQVAQLYYSGCSVSQHISFAAQDQAVYKYRTHDNRYPANYSTLRQALNAEVWDVIILHEMNNSAAAESNYTGTNKRNLQKHINYIKQYSLNSEAELIWNFSWANPTSQALWDLGYPADLAYNTYNWVENYKEAYGPEISVMYGNMLEAMKDKTRRYVMTNENIADVIPTGLAFKYARDNNPNQADPDLLLYNDYTHAGPGFGRLLAGYVWYATLMGKTELTELNYTRDLTDAEQELLLDAVNYALANKNTLK